MSKKEKREENIEIDIYIYIYSIEHFVVASDAYVDGMWLC